MRVLVVVEGWPWPATSRRGMRRAALVEGLAIGATVDLCVLDPAGNRPPAEAAGALRRFCHRVAVIEAPAGDANQPAPWWWNNRARARTVAARLVQALPGGHDQVWYDGPRSFLLVGRRPAARTVVDLGGGPSSPGDRAVRRVTRDADVVLVPTDTDRDRVGPAAVVVPDPCTRLAPRTPLPAGDGHRRVLVVSGPVPRDGAAFGEHHRVTERVVARLRHRIPGLQVRVLGSDEDADNSAFDRAAELASADAVIVAASGRDHAGITVLEALAHGRPVVATTGACAGLGLVPGVHAHIADDVAGLAESAAAVLLERPLADRLARSGHALWLERHDHGLVVRRIAAIARSGAVRQSGPGVDLDLTADAGVPV